MANVYTEFSNLAEVSVNEALYPELNTNTQLHSEDKVTCAKNGKTRN